jgi:hypothetical protein
MKTAPGCGQGANAAGAGSTGTTTQPPRVPRRRRASWGRRRLEARQSTLASYPKTPYVSEDFCKFCNLLLRIVEYIGECPMSSAYNM